MFLFDAKAFVWTTATGQVGLCYAVSATLDVQRIFQKYFGKKGSGEKIFFDSQKVAQQTRKLTVWVQTKIVFSTNKVIEKSKRASVHR